ncbi:ABC transporter ATP-binding protein [Verrucomicrobiota bacterium]
MSKTFGTTRALAGVSLAVEPGELFFLLGPSGCGKTTLLRCIAGFCEPDSGKITIGDRDVTSLPPHQRDAGMVFQSYALWPHMTVRENVSFGLEIRKLGRREIAARLEQALSMVKMSERADAKPNQLSGGQQQRVALARALVIHPQCLLLDEPLSNLDAKLRLEMRSEIRRICKEAGLTAIYVTHDQKEALSIADRLAILDDGVIRQVGAPREVYLRPASRFVANFIGETNLLDGEVARAAQGEASIRTAMGTLVSRVAGSAPPETGARVTVSLRPEVIRVGDAPAGASNVLEGVVRNTVYLGEIAQHEVHLPSEGRDDGKGTTLKAFDLNPKIVARDTQEKASVWIEPEDVVVLTE